MTKRLGMILALWMASVPAMAASYTLTAAQWAELRHGVDVARAQPLAAAVQAWLAQPDVPLTIGHADTDEGANWAAELQRWLVALGVPSSTVRFVPGRDTPDNDLQITIAQEAHP